jgi:tRNA uridine 5-carboxymethylaminomethyl modification enzyme
VQMEHNADIIVIGAGHAGCEAAWAASKMGCKTILFTLNYNNIAFMPCNPSIGGPAKGHLVREIDAIGGIMGKIIDRTYLQMRLLNTQKGPAVWALRAQADKQTYQRSMIKQLESQTNLEIRQAEIVDLIFNEDCSVAGAITRTGTCYHAPVVILATGTFLNGRIFIGKLNYPSGPMGQLPANFLAQALQKKGIRFKRFKTGTPARVRRRSLDFSKMIVQPGRFDEHGFSFWEPWQVRSEYPCWLTYTTRETHQIIREHLNEAALYTGDITGTGPRYCPSIEGKLINYPDKDRHQVFIEPEGADTDEMYLAGLSTSLPEYVQEKFLRTIPGLEKLELVRPGYAIEYDYIPGDQLGPSLEAKKIPGLFAAGQINGSSGYEEAAAQGLIAGINATRKVQRLSPLVLKRSEAYIGVLIDDLVTKENTEPYRVLTSRAEYRLTLRADNADQRLSRYGIEIGLLDETQKNEYEEKVKQLNQIYHDFKSRYYNPDARIQAIFSADGIQPPKNRFCLADLLKRPDVTLTKIAKIAPDLSYNPVYTMEVAIQLRYEGYLIKEREQVRRMLNLEEKKIPEDIYYKKIPNLAREAYEKLDKYRPLSIGQASRISGINPADLTALIFYLENNKRGKS